MIDRVLILDETSIDPGNGDPSYALPVVPDAEYATQQADGHYTAHGPATAVPGRRGKTHPTILYLWRASPGRYAVYGDASAIAKMDPGSAAKTLVDYGKTAEATDWPCKDNGSCVVPSIIGLNDSRPFKKHPTKTDDTLK